jgi:hypothetical protein
VLIAKQHPFCAAIVLGKSNPLIVSQETEDLEPHFKRHSVDVESVYDWRLFF